MIFALSGSGFTPITSKMFTENYCDNLSNYYFILIWDNMNLRLTAGGTR